MRFKHHTHFDLAQNPSFHFTQKGITMKVSGIFWGILLAIFCTFFTTHHASAAPEVRLGLNAPILKVNTERNNDPSIVYDTTYGIGASLSIGYRFMFMGVYLEQDLEGIFGEKDFADSRFLGGTYLTFRVIGTFNTIELEAGFGLGAMYMASTQPDIMIDCDGHAESAASFAMKFTIGATARFGEVGIGLHLDYDLGINPQTLNGDYEVTQYLHDIQPGLHFMYAF